MVEKTLSQLDFQNVYGSSYAENQSGLNNGLKNLAIAVLSRAIEDYLDEEPGSKYHEDSKSFFLSGGLWSFYLDLAPEMTSSVERTRILIYRSVIESDVGKLESDLGEVKKALAYLKGAYSHDIGKDKAGVGVC